MTLTLITGPTVEPLALEEAKDHLRVDGDDQDAQIAGLIVALRGRLDGRDGTLGRALNTQTWDLTLDGFPGRRSGQTGYRGSYQAAEAIIVPLPPLQSVTTITYIDTAGDTQTLGASLYTVDAKAQPGRIVPAYGESWPSARGEINAVTVRFVAGYGAAGSDIPEPIRQAGLLLLGHWFEHREDVVAGVSVAEMPMASRSLLAPYEVHEF